VVEREVDEGCRFTQGVIDNNPYAGFQQYALADVHTLAKV